MNQSNLVLRLAQMYPTTESVGRNDVTHSEKGSQRHDPPVNSCGVSRHRTCRTFAKNLHQFRPAHFSHRPPDDLICRRGSTLSFSLSAFTLYTESYEHGRWMSCSYSVGRKLNYLILARPRSSQVCTVVPPNTCVECNHLVAVACANSKSLDSHETGRKSDQMIIKTDFKTPTKELLFYFGSFDSKKPKIRSSKLSKTISVGISKYGQKK